MSRIALVFGATGTQGAAVVSALLADPEKTFSVHAITRDPSSEKGKALAALGAKVVKADAWDIESLKKAMDGVEVVFAVTNFYDPSIYPNNVTGEIQQGKNIADAAKAAGIKFFVWSSLPNASRFSKGKYNKIFHYDNKAAIEEYLKSIQLPSTFLHTGWFLENLWNFGCFVKNDDGFLLPVPNFSGDSRQTILAVGQDLGPVVLALFKKYQKRKDLWYKILVVGTERMTYPQLAELLEKELGKPVKFTTPESSGMQEIDDMYAYQSEYQLYMPTPIPDPQVLSLGIKVGTLEDFVRKEVKPRFG